MKEKEKLIKAIKDVYNTYENNLGKGIYLNTNELFDIINYEYNFSVGVSKNQISSVITKNTKFEKYKKNNDIYGKRFNKTKERSIKMKEKTTDELLNILQYL